MLEAPIRRKGIEFLHQLGCKTLKCGQEGWPDDLVIFAPQRHFWIEWKAPGKGMTPAQKVRIPQLQKSGEPVYICESKEDAQRALQLEKLLWRVT